MKEVLLRTDLCVVGGGLAGMCAAISAAQHGTKVVLMQDRPMLGGNASSEIRMWVCGAHGENNRETGLLEEFELENMYRNPSTSYSIWDSILYEKVRFEKNITLLLNCSCNDLTMEGKRIKFIRGWQTTTQIWYTVEADLFVDCSGDSVLAPLSDAEYRTGREAAEEFNESIEPEKADKQTMGMSCLIQARQTDRPQTFIPPVWANKYLSDDDMAHRNHDISQWSTNFWWIELGGDRDSIYDTEELRDELLKIAFGVWDHIKNHGDHGAENWVLDWVGFLPGKRESRRYVGDYILNQNDVEAGGRFDDIIAYGGWTLDDHHPEGFNYSGYPNISIPVPSPFGIPYRCLYSKNIDNLLFAGRNISVSHAVLSATRVMATCSIIGQAVGIASAIALRDGLSPRGVYENRIEELQQTLMDDDCYIPWHKREMPQLTQKAVLTSSEGNAEPLRNGIDRPIGDEDNGWTGSLQTSWIEYKFDKEEQISELRFVFDSDLNRKVKNMPCSYPLNNDNLKVPKTLIRKFRVEAMDNNGQWTTVVSEDNNYQRLIKIKKNFAARAVRFIPEGTWGAEKAHLYAWDIK